MSVADLAKALQGAIGGNDEHQEVDKYIDTGIPLFNQILCGKADGGIPQGRLMEVFAGASTGKTLLATHFMQQAQKQGGIAGFFDHERSFIVTLAEKIGLDSTFPNFIYKQPATWEKSNTMMVQAAKMIRDSKVIADDAPILFVLDSIASCLTESMVGKNFDELNMNDTTALSRVTSTTLKSMAHYANEFNFTVIYLNQIRQKPGVVYGDATTTPGGSAMEFFSTVRLSMTRAQIKEGKEFVGQTINIKTVKNKLTRPHQLFSLDVFFDDDGFAKFDLTGALIDSAVALGKLTKQGNRVDWNGKLYYPKQLIQVINTEGSIDKLRALATPEPGIELVVNET